MFDVLKEIVHPNIEIVIFVPGIYRNLPPGRSSWN